MAEALALQHLGEAYMAVDYLLQTPELARKVPYPPYEAEILYNLGFGYLRLGN